jgi:curli biogenesis system outer membrane secretion channel CsgG
MKFIKLITAACIPLSTLTLTLLGEVLLPAAGQASEVQIAQSQPHTRLRIAVLDFDFASTGLTGGAYSFFNGAGPAQGVSDLLTNKLVQNGTYTLIERSRIAEVLREQDLGQAGRLDPGTAAQVGRILGADVVVIGSITRFNLSEGRSGTSILGIGGTNGRATADVQLTARLVNTTSAEILAAVDGAGTARQGSGGFSVGGLVTVGSDTSNSDALLSKAAEDAVDQVTNKLAAEAPRLAALPPSLPVVQALVADVSGNQVIINRGSQDGFRVGMTLSIERVMREVKDPTSGAVLRTVTSPIGQIELTDVDAKSGIGRVVSGTGFRVGDMAKAGQ